MPRMLAALAIAAILFGIRPVRADEMRPAPEQVAEPAPGEMALPVRARHGLAVVRAESGLEELAEQVAWRADDTFTEIAPDLAGLDTPRQVEIRLVRDAADMQRAAPRGASVPPWAAGVAFPRDGVVVVAQWRGAQRLDPLGTIDHELAHLALGAALGDHAPRWLHEGFAYLHSTDWSADRAQTLAGMAWFGSTIPLEQLDVGFPAEELPASRAYAESYDFVYYLANRGRFAEHGDDGDRYPFRVFLAELSRGADLDRAAVHAYGRPLRPLFDEWQSDLKQRYMFLPIGLFLLSIWLLGVVLLVLAWRRRRRQSRSRLAEWERIEREAREREEAARRPPPPPPPARRSVPAVPIWAGPGWAPPGEPVTELPESDDVDAVLEDDDEAPHPTTPPRSRPVN